MRRRTLIVLALFVGAIVTAVATASTSVEPYVVPVGNEYEVEALFSVNDTVPVLGGAPNATYRMVGIPDGLGAHSNGNGTSTLFMNHELGHTALSEPYVGGVKNEGAIVSKWILDADGDPIAGKRAYDTVFVGDTLIGDAATAANSTPAFARFCSGSLAGPAQGFDRWIYFANEENAAPATFDGKGGLAVAIFDNNGVGEAHALPALGRFNWENTLVQRNTGDQTVIMGMEDGPSSQIPANGNSQLYLYVGTKSDAPGATVLQKNGLVGGTLYVFRSKNRNRNSEFAFRNGTLVGEWVPLPGAAAMTDAQLEAASDAAGAMVFARPEDGAFNPSKDDEYFFVTTGDAPASGEDTGNKLGRLYSLKLNPSDPAKDATLSVVYNADEIIAAGGDVAISPDNIDASGDYLMINEDGTTPSRPVMGAKARDGSIWRFDLKPSGGIDPASAVRIAQLNPPGRDGAAVGPGVWETSGIIDASHLFGPDTWLSDVQAHSPTAAPGGSTVTVEDGQLFLLRPTT
jgi:Bacterial protein of unknown function (DUF839)